MINLNGTQIMTTKLARNIANAESKYGSITVIHKGVTGGGWLHDVEIRVLSYERNNLARYVRQHPDFTPFDDGKRGSGYLPSEYRVILGAKNGGVRGCRAKQFEYAIIKINQ